MKKTFFLLVLAVLLTSFSGCAYVNIQTPYDSNLDKTELGAKKGTAATYSILWLFTWGNGGYAAAAKNGDITVMKHADQEVVTLLFGLYSRRTIIVYGD